MQTSSSDEHHCCSVRLGTVGAAWAVFGIVGPALEPASSQLKGTGAMVKSGLRPISSARPFRLRRSYIN